LPGIVPDPGNAAPESEVAEGFDLDGYEGKGEPPPLVHRHKNFVSTDGRTGIDNQLYTVEACVPGFRPDGNIPKIVNEMMRNGALSILLEISGIEGEFNGISVAYQLEGVRAFIPPRQVEGLSARSQDSGRKPR